MNISLQEAITERHSVRKYKDKALEDNVIEVLQQAIETCNRDGNLRIQLVLDEPKGFSGIQSYGAFSNVRNYLHFEYVAATNDSLPTVKATRTFSLIGYTKLDLGIAKLHFEIGAGKDNFMWG